MRLDAAATARALRTLEVWWRSLVYSGQSTYSQDELALLELYRWLDQTPSGHGLTSESDAAYAARRARE